MRLPPHPGLSQAETTEVAQGRGALGLPLGVGE